MLFLLCLILSVVCDFSVENFNAGYDFRFDKQLSLPLFDYSYSENKSYVIPGGNGRKTEFPVPDQLHVSSNINHKEKSLAGCYYTYESFLYEYVSSSYFHIGLDVIIFAIGVDTFHEIGHIRENITSNTSMATLSSIRYNLFNIQSYPAHLIPKSAQFKMFLEQLPTSLETEKDKKIVTEFITKFGTSYVTSASYGGRIHLDTVMKQSFVANKSVDWVKNQVELYFRYKMFSLSGGWSTNKSDIHIDQEFIKNVEATSWFKGGFLKYQTLDTLNDWLYSVYEYPAQVDNVNYRPLWELVENEEKRNTLKQATNNYIKTGKIL